MSGTGGSVRPVDARENGMANQQDCRDRRLRELKAKIREGTYKPDIRDIAHYLVRVIEPSL